MESYSNIFDTKSSWTTSWEEGKTEEIHPTLVAEGGIRISGGCNASGNEHRTCRFQLISWLAGVRLSFPLAVTENPTRVRQANVCKI